ncbi:MAG: hypothetical protein Q8R51_09165, partial [Azonexus sp.]|nr:hypothetical protein [Azonexus sp.]
SVNLLPCLLGKLRRSADYPIGRYMKIKMRGFWPLTAAFWWLAEILPCVWAVLMEPVKKPSLTEPQF